MVQMVMKSAYPKQKTQAQIPDQGRWLGEGEGVLASPVFLSWKSTWTETGRL